MYVTGAAACFDEIAALVVFPGTGPDVIERKIIGTECESQSAGLAAFQPDLFEGLQFMLGTIDRRVLRIDIDLDDFRTVTLAGVGQFESTFNTAIADRPDRHVAVGESGVAQSMAERIQFSFRIAVKVAVTDIEAVGIEDVVLILPGFAARIVLESLCPCKRKTAGRIGFAGDDVGDRISSLKTRIPCFQDG